MFKRGAHILFLALASFTGVVGAQELMAPAGLASSLKSLEGILDFSQMGEKYNLYYKSFFEGADFFKRNWNYYSSAGAAPLSEFVSDGCSAFPDGTVAKPKLWRDCCIVHDLAYWFGGTKEQKQEADHALGVCVQARLTSAYTEAELYGRIVRVFEQTIISGVALGGRPGFYSPWRWGYGRPNFQGYRAYTPAEKAEGRRWLRIYEQRVRTKKEKFLGKYGVPTDLRMVSKAVRDFLSRYL